MGIYEKVLKGDIAASAKLMREIEEHSRSALGVVKKLYRHAGKAHVIGLTGAPGVGKSTLVDRLTGLLLAQGKTVGVVAVDPTSPFTGGAVLGDRVRMRASGRDPRIFIKSLASRGGSGGLASTTGDIICVLDASGRTQSLWKPWGWVRKASTSWTWPLPLFSSLRRAPATMYSI